MARNTNRLPSAEVDRLLTLYAQTQRTEYRDRVIEAHLYIAEIIARKFSGKGVDYDDLYQVAAMALFKAAGRFDPEKGVQFSSFVTPSMVGEVKNYFRDKSRSIRPPRRSSELARIVEKVREELTQSLHRAPRVDEIAKAADLSEDEVLEGLEAAASQPVSLDMNTTDDDEQLTLGHAIGAEEKGYSAFETSDMLRRGMALLNDRQREVLTLRFFENMSQREVAEHLGISQMSVSRAERAALEQLRAAVTEE